jgi:hypothetical protein
MTPCIEPESTNPLVNSVFSITDYLSFRKFSQIKTIESFGGAAFRISVRGFSIGLVSLLVGSPCYIAESIMIYP